MAAGESAVDRAAMAQAASQVDAALSVIRGLQTRMNGYNSALQADWAGQAAATFNSTYEAFSIDFTKVLNALQAMQEKLVTTQRTYATAEGVNTDQVNRIAALLNK